MINLNEGTTNHAVDASTARKEIVNAVNKVADLVKSTLGARGKNIVIQKEFGIPIVTKDGVTVANMFKPKDNMEKIGMDMIKEVAKRTNREAGDGTTTATVLAQAIINNGMKYIEAGFNPYEIQRGMKDTASFAMDYIAKHHKRDIVTLNDIKDIATISTNGDRELGGIISDVFDKIGNNGVVTLENSPNEKTYSTITEGFFYDKGYLSPYFINDMEKNCCVLNDVFVFLCADIINNPSLFEKIVKFVTANNGSLMIICEDMSEEIMMPFIQNKLSGKLKVCVTRIPGMTLSTKTEALSDISSITSARVIGNECGFPLIEASKLDPSQYLGIAKKIIIKKDETTIISLDDPNIKELKETHVKSLTDQYKATESAFEKEMLQKRIAKINGGIGVIYVGAMTEIEMKEKKYRIEDAINATKSAIEMGIVEGGGIALLRAHQEIRESKHESSDYNLGVKIIKESIIEPLNVISKSAGLRDSEIYNNCTSKKMYGYVLLNSAEKIRYIKSMFNVGIIDPYKVTYHALMNSVSVAGTIMNIEGALVIDEKTFDPNKI